MRMKILLGGASAILLLGAGCPKAPEIKAPIGGQQPAPSAETAPETAVVTPSVAVADQAVIDGSVTVASVVAVAQSWIVIHASNNNAPGPVIGYTGIGAGESKDIKIGIDLGKVTSKLYAMLHEDTGVLGSYEFPTDDLPAKDGETVITVAFNVTTPAASAGATVGVKTDAKIEAKTPSTPPVDTTPAPAPATNPDSVAPISAVKSFTVTAKTWSFEPATIKVKKGDTVKLTITSLDVPHGFPLSAFGINKTLDPNQTVNVEFVADKAGTFPFFCSVFCGSGHSGMKGSLVVEE